MTVKEERLATAMQKSTEEEKEKRMKLQRKVIQWKKSKYAMVLLRKAFDREMKKNVFKNLANTVANSLGEKQLEKKIGEKKSS